MAISDVLTQVESATTAGSRRTPARDAVATESRSPNSRYREQLARSLNKPDSADSQQAATDDVESPAATAVEESGATDSPPSKSPTAESGSSALDASRSNGQKPSANGRQDQSDIIPASVPEEEFQNSQFPVFVCDAEVVIETGLLVSTEPAAPEGLKQEDDDETRVADAPFGVQSLEGAPPAQLQLPAINEIQLGSQVPIDEEIKPPAGLKVSIPASQPQTQLPKLSTVDADAALPQPPAGFLTAIENCLAGTSCEPSPAPAEGDGKTKALAPNEFHHDIVKPTLPEPIQGASTSQTDLNIVPQESNSTPIEPVAVLETASEADGAQVDTDSNLLPVAPVQDSGPDAVPVGFATQKVAAEPAASSNFAANEGTEFKVEISDAEHDGDTTIQSDKQTSKKPGRFGDEARSDSPNTERQSNPIQTGGPNVVAQAPSLKLDAIATPANGDDQTVESMTTDSAEETGPVTVPVQRNESTAKASTAHSLSRPSDLDPGEFTDRIANAVRQSHDAGRQLRIRLSPPELGALQIEVSLRDGALSARLDVQTQAAHQAVVENLSLLHDALAQHGRTVDRIDVQIVRNWNEDAGTQSGQEQEGQFERQSSNGREQQQRQSEPEPEFPADPRPPQSTVSQLDELDIQV